MTSISLFNGFLIFTLGLQAYTMYFEQMKIHGDPTYD